MEKRAGGEKYVLDASKIGEDEKLEKFKKRVIAEHLLTLEDKKSFAAGDLVTTIEGPYAGIGLMTVEVRDDGITRVAPAPNSPTVEIPTQKLYHFDDYLEAFKIALVEEQLGKSKTEQ